MLSLVGISGNIGTKFFFVDESLDVAQILVSSSRLLPDMEMSFPRQERDREREPIGFPLPQKDTMKINFDGTRSIQNKKGNQGWELLSETRMVDYWWQELKKGFFHPLICKM